MSNPEKTTACDRHRELARRWFVEVWNERRSDTIVELLHPHCIGHHEGQETHGPQDIEAMRSQLLGLIPDMRVIIEAIIAEGHETAVRWRFEGHHGRGPAARPVTFHGITWLKFKGDRIIEGWDRWNQGAFVQRMQAL